MNIINRAFQIFRRKPFKIFWRRQQFFWLFRLATICSFVTLAGIVKVFAIFKLFFMFSTIRLWYLASKWTMRKPAENTVNRLTAAYSKYIACHHTIWKPAFPLQVYHNLLTENTQCKCNHQKVGWKPYPKTQKALGIIALMFCKCLLEDENQVLSSKIGGVTKNQKLPKKN